MSIRCFMVVGLLLLLAALPAGGAWPKTGRSVVPAKHGMVAASQPAPPPRSASTCSNPMAATPSTPPSPLTPRLGQFMEPTSCGLGGDLFAIVWDAKAKKLYGLNASGRSPYGTSRKLESWPTAD